MYILLKFLEINLKLIKKKTHEYIGSSFINELSIYVKRKNKLNTHVYFSNCFRPVKPKVLSNRKSKKQKKIYAL